MDAGSTWAMHLLNESKACLEDARNYLAEAQEHQVAMNAMGPVAEHAKKLRQEFRSKLPESALLDPRTTATSVKVRPFDDGDLN